MSKKIDLIDVVRKGGNSTKKRYGREFYSKIAKLSRRNISPEYYKNLSKQGVEARWKKKKEKNNPLNRVVEIFSGVEAKVDAVNIK